MAAGHCWTCCHLVCFGGGRSDRAAAELGLVGHKVVGELQNVICHLAFQHSVQLSLISSTFELQSLTLNILVATFFFFFLSFISEVFYIKPAGYALSCTSSISSG